MTQQLARHDIARALAIAVLFGLLAYGGIALTRAGGRIATLWLPNAVLSAVLLRSGGRKALLPIMLCIIANIVAEVAAGDVWHTAFVLSAANAAEVCLVIHVLRWSCGRDPDVTDLPTLGWLSMMCVAAPSVSGTIAGLALGANGEGFSDGNFVTWMLADGLSLMIVTPIAMIGIDAWRARSRPSKADVVEWTAVLVGTVGGAALIFAQSRFPFLFLACPIVIVAAFRTGVEGTALSVALISVVASVATLQGSGPIMLVHGDFGAKLVALQLFLATSFSMGLPVAAALNGRATIRRDLQASRDFNQSILDDILEIVFRTDATGCWTFLNPAWERVTGYSVAESLGWPTTKLLHEEDRASVLPTYSQIASGEITETILKQRFYRANGECCHIEVVVRRLCDAQGSFSGTTGNIRDVTERVRHEHALIESERRFQALANLAPAGIFRTDDVGECNYVNAAWLRITGLGYDEWQGSGWSKAIHPDDLQRVFDGWGAAVREQRQYRAEFRWVRPDGSFAWTDVSAAPELDELGNAIGFIGVTMDITERRRAEDELALRDQQLMLLADNATDAVFRLTLTGHCIYASPSARMLIGVDPTYLVGAQMLDRLHPDDADGVHATLGALASGEADSRIVAYRSEPLGQRGIYRWMEAHCGLVRDDTGRPNEVIASIRDISNSKALEEDLKDARRRAEAAAEAKAVFLANMSHEIRTPMNGVLGFTELLAASSLDVEQRRYVQLIADSGRAMMRLLNDILDLSKIDAGQIRVASEPVSLEDKMNKCARLMEPVARGKGIHLSVVTDSSLPQHILGDPLRIRQILLNLIGNAVKFTDTGTVMVRAQSAGDRVLIDVADSGCGIPADRLEVIFQQFAQADASIAQRYGGTGLGLSISADLAKLMGGSIGVSSVVGQGTIFTLSLPLVIPEELTDEPAVSAPLASLASNSFASAPRVLIAEDHDINQVLILAMARAAGFDPVIAANGREAVELVAAAQTSGQPFDLVLMDMQMPVLGGLAATQELRTLGFTVPIIALTANAYAEDVAGCREAGMQAHLSKPVRLRDLQDIAERFLGFTAEHAPSPSVTSNSLLALAPISTDTAVDPVPLIPSGKKSIAERYHDRKIETLEAVSAAVRRGALTGAEVEQLADMLHKLAGTAGFFGDANLGEHAAALEHVLSNAPADRILALLVTGLQALEDAA